MTLWIVVYLQYIKFVRPLAHTSLIETLIHTYFPDAYFPDAYFPDASFPDASFPDLFSPSLSCHHSFPPSVFIPSTLPPSYLPSLLPSLHHTFLPSSVLTSINSIPPHQYTYIDIIVCHIQLVLFSLHNDYSVIIIV